MFEKLRLSDFETESSERRYEVSGAALSESDIEFSVMFPDFCVALRRTVSLDFESLPDWVDPAVCEAVHGRPLKSLASRCLNPALVNS